MIGPEMIVSQVARIVDEAEIGDRLTVRGPSDVLPSLYQVTAAATAAVAAAAVGAGRLLAARNGGPRSGVEVDTRHACAAFRSERHLRVNGRPLPDPWDPISGYYRTRDHRWIQLHCNFSHHRNGVLDLLGVPNEREAVQAAVARFDAEPLELELQAMGMCATMARDEAEWRAHPQGKAVDELPLLEIEPIGEAPAAPIPPAERPAEGIRVLDLTRIIAGPVCGRMLAAYGADVLRVGSAHLPEVQAALVDTGFGKRNTFLNLRVDADARRLRELVTTADVVVQAYRPGALVRLGFGPEALARIRPGIVVATISTYGRTGPWSGLRGFDSLVQTASGFALGAARATGAERPRPLPAQVLDHATGYLAAYAVMTALARRGSVGGSWHARLSLAQTGHWLRDLGQRDMLRIAEPARADVEEFCRKGRSEFGELSYVAPPGRLAAAPEAPAGGATAWSRPAWTRGPASLGTSEPSWEPRAPECESSMSATSL